MTNGKFIRATALVLLVSQFLSCKKDKSNDTIDNIKTLTIESSSRVVLDILVPLDDVFQLFYLKEGTSNFSEEMSVRLIVDGSNLSQELIFELPEDIVITRLRIDVGENTEQAQMQINNFYFQYFNKKFEVKGKDFFRYFLPSGEITVEDSNTTFKLNQITEPYDPGFYQIDNLLTEELKNIQN